MKVFFAIAMMAASLVYGQNKPAEVNTEGWEAVNIPVKSLTSEDSFNRLLRLLSVFGSSAHVAGDSQLRTISVYAPRAVVAQIRHVLEDLDKPGSEALLGRNVEMTLTFLRCSAKPPGTTASLPPDMEAVARQLRAATTCKDVQVWDSVPLHLQEGKEADETLRLPGTLPGTQANATAEIRIRADSVGQKSQARYVRFGVMRVNLRIPIPDGNFPSGMPSMQYANVGINTAGDFMESQKTVLGKVSGMEEGGSIFVVIALKILD